ncbi:MAG TPA: alkaline phosphatase PhoX [Burkholderiales bacterium]|nr:alkaline phosphatase PhoX [Burkholderiales bacterium]
MENQTKTSPRRNFFKSTGAVVTGATLSALGAHMALAHDDHGRGHDRDDDRRRGRRSDYGDLQPTPDQDGSTVLALPKDFRYVTFSKTGEAFGNGLLVARNHDGMACFEGRGDIVRLIRNHEVRNAAGDFTLGVNAPAHLRYDPKGMGGCMTLDFDTKRKRLVRQFISIGGTIVNCSGGWSLHNSGWITCEETTAGVNNGFEKPHGYNFFVPASADSTVPAVPFKAMGRFSHEASVADDRGIVYQTEDSGNNSGFYRFIPNDPRNLLAGGSLQMLAVTGNPTAALFTGQRVGVRLPVSWVPIPVPDPSLEAGGMSCFAQGRAVGGAAFNRLEGVFRGEDGRSMYFVSTSGGTARGPANDPDGFGQLWHYLPGDERYQEGDQLVLVFESPSGSVLESPDNLCLTPNGGVLFCEDDAVNDGDTHALATGLTDINRMVGLGPKGEVFTFAVNVLNDSEFAGACFSSDGEVLFVNVFGDGTPGSGMTCAIWGPWERGPL